MLFFSGKGGVGKSTVTAAMALLAAQEGKRVLVVDVDAKGNLTDLFEHPPVGFKPVEVHPGVHVMTMHTEESLHRPEQCTMNHHGLFAGAIFRHVFQLETLWQVEIELNGR